MVSFARRLADLADAAPDRPAGLLRRGAPHPPRARRPGHRAGPRPRRPRRDRGGDGHDRAAQLGRLVRRRGGGVEAGRRAPAGRSPPAGAGAGRDRRPRRPGGRHRRAARGGRRPPDAAGRPRAAGGACRRVASARRRPARLEGADVGRLHRPPQADRGRRPAAWSTPTASSPCGSGRTAAWSCPGRCTTTARSSGRARRCCGARTWRCCRASTPRPRWRPSRPTAPTSSIWSPR